jgi:hypothetical protein
MGMSKVFFGSKGIPFDILHGYGFDLKGHVLNSWLLADGITRRW